ncbi:MAG: hypothetical protein J0L84_03355 [Verrucomicrobia bacterium]|nr:hypothetical protein [Verrucomicrobiota bacterium]
MKRTALLLILSLCGLAAGCTSAVDRSAEVIPDRYLAMTIAGQCDAECDSPAIRDGEIWCTTNEACRAAGCECRLFRLSKKNPGEWEKLPRGKSDHEPSEYFYRCWCVKKTKD